MASQAGDLWRLALPAATSILITNGYAVVALLWVHLLGEQAVAGLAAVTIVPILLKSAAQLVTFGATAIVAMHSGENARERMRDASRSAVRMGLWIGGILALAGVAITTPLVGVFGLEPGAQDAAESYLRVLFIGQPITIAWFVIESVYRGAGDTATPLRFATIGLALNAALDPFWILGAGGFSGWGVAGAAWAAIVGQAVSLWLGWRDLQRKGLLPAWHACLGWLDRESVEMVRIGIPSSATTIIVSLVHLWIFSFAGRFGQAAVAALGIGYRIHAFIAYPVGFGFGIAATALVGQRLGAGDARGAKRAGWIAAHRAALLMASIHLPTLVAAPFVVAWFSSDPAVLALGVVFLRINAFVEPLKGYEFTLHGAFAGSGTTLPGLTSIVPAVLASVPLAWLLGDSFGFAGVTIAIASATVLRALGLLIRYVAVDWAPRVGHT